MSMHATNINNSSSTLVFVTRHFVVLVLRFSFFVHKLCTDVMRQKLKVLLFTFKIESAFQQSWFNKVMLINYIDYGCFCEVTGIVL